jgi:hypothetical protein
MQLKASLLISRDVLTVTFVPFLIVLFVEFVLRFGMGPFVEKVSFFSATFASLIALSAFVWIRKGIVWGFIPIIVSSGIMVFLHRILPAVRLRFLYFFLCFFLLTFLSVLVYAVAKVSRRHSSSYARSIAVFFMAIIMFLGTMAIVDLLFGFLDPEMAMVQSLMQGIRSGTILGCGVSMVILLLSQRDR